MFQSLHEMVFLSFDSLIMRGAFFLHMCVCNTLKLTFWDIFRYFLHWRLWELFLKNMLISVPWFSIEFRNMYLSNNQLPNKLNRIGIPMSLRKKYFLIHRYTKWYFEREDKRFTKGSFFWDQILDMSSSGLPIRKASDWLLPIWSTN